MFKFFITFSRDIALCANWSRISLWLGFLEIRGLLVIVFSLDNERSLNFLSNLRFDIRRYLFCIFWFRINFKHLSLTSIFSIVQTTINSSNYFIFGLYIIILKNNFHFLMIEEWIGVCFDHILIFTSYIFLCVFYYT